MVLILQISTILKFVFKYNKSQNVTPEISQLVNARYFHFFSLYKFGLPLFVKCLQPRQQLFFFLSHLNSLHHKTNRYKFLKRRTLCRKQLFFLYLGIEICIFDSHIFLSVFSTKFHFTDNLYSLLIIFYLIETDICSYF